MLQILCSVQLDLFCMFHGCYDVITAVGLHHTQNIRIAYWRVRVCGCTASESGARVSKSSSVCLSVGRMWSVWEAVQSSVHVSCSHASAHRRKAAQMHGQSLPTFTHSTLTKPTVWKHWSLQVSRCSAVDLEVDRAYSVKALKVTGLGV